MLNEVDIAPSELLIVVFKVSFKLEISDFKLQAQIIEADRKTYGFELGTAEGVHLDDGFHIVEFEEDSK